MRQRLATILIIEDEATLRYPFGRALERAGFARLHNLDGGVDAWAKTVEASMPVY